MKDGDTFLAALTHHELLSEHVGKLPKRYTFLPAYAWSYNKLSM